MIDQETVKTLENMETFLHEIETGVEDGCCRCPPDTNCDACGTFMGTKVKIPGYYRKIIVATNTTKYFGGVEKHFTICPCKFYNKLGPYEEYLECISKPAKVKKETEAVKELRRRIVLYRHFVEVNS